MQMASHVDASPSLDADVAGPMTPAGGGSGPSSKARDKLPSKLADQSFCTSRYPDPLAPRQDADRRFYPKGVTAEMERNWLARIKAVRDGAGTAGTGKGI